MIVTVKVVVCSLFRSVAVLGCVQSLLPLHSEPYWVWGPRCTPTLSANSPTRAVIPLSIFSTFFVSPATTSFSIFHLLGVDPWEHVLGMGLGVVFVNQLVKWEAQVEQDLDKMLEKAKAANERRYIGSL